MVVEIEREYVTLWQATEVFKKPKGMAHTRDLDGLDVAFAHNREAIFRRLRRV